MNSANRRLVWQRANSQCEYCRLNQQDEPYFRFHIEHIISRQHGGDNNPQYLALACHYCNQRKGTNLAAIDPKSDKVVRLFHPRTQHWQQHFRRLGARIVGRTPCGRATVSLLDMNARDRVLLRKALI